MRKIFLLLLALPVSLVACEPLSSSVLSLAPLPSIDSTDENSSSIDSYDSVFEGDATKLNDVTPRGEATKRYVEVPNSDTVLYENESYIELEDVAAYLQFFDHMPSNYVDNVRLVASDNDYVYYGGEFQNREGYLPSGYSYTEMDIRAGYTIGGSVSRGAQRIVFGERNGNIEKVFYTADHYEDFQEYLGYENGWSYEFGANGIDYVPPVTGDCVYVDGEAVFGWDYTLD